MKRTFKDLVVAFQFLSRLPVPNLKFDSESLSRAVKFFPVVGLLIGVAASWLQRLLAPHLSRTLMAIVVLIFLVLVTGALHEDGLADAVDGFGGGWTRERMLTIMRDSKIGAYGAIAIALSLMARVLLLSSLPLNRFTPYVVSAHVLCRWTALPLSYFVQPARPQEGQGARIARRTSLGSLMIGTGMTIVIVGFFMRTGGWTPIVVAVVVTALSGFYYWKRLGGVTGDCFGATTQLTEIAVYFCGVWNA
jgi:adenosylcobinamide-GDP ribazoletransferase